MRALLCILGLIVGGLVSGHAAWAAPVSVPPGSTYNTPGGNSVTSNGAAPIIVDCWFVGADEEMEVTGNGATVNL